MANGQGRQPRAYLIVNGVKCIPLDVSISMSSNRNADTFSATLPLFGDRDEAFFADESPINIEIMATNDQTAGQWVQMFSGECDVPVINFATRRVIVTGRDKTAALMETKTTEKWLNKTSEEIVKEIAGRVGLTADVSVKNADKVGLIYKDDYNRISNQDVLWNVLTVLAEREGCALFVKVDRLIFKPFDELDGGDFNVFYQRPTAASFADGSFLNLSCRRNLAVAKNVSVSVKTWQQKQAKSLSTSFRSTGRGTGKADYTYRIPNATKENIDKIAKNKLAEITAQERLVDLDMPGDVQITPENKLVLSGTNTEYDQSYIISGVRHEMSQGGGYRMSLNARSPDDKNKIEQES